MHYQALVELRRERRYKSELCMHALVLPGVIAQTLN
jgi:hypothetical protein